MKRADLHRRHADAPRDEPTSAEQSLSGYEVLLIVCGGIAAYKSATVVSRLVQRGCGVSVVMSRAARKFITPLTMRALSARPVFSSLWETDNPRDQQHLTLTERADLIVVAPATANILAKARMGLADDLPSTLLLSAVAPTLFAPAMNPRMWSHPAVIENVSVLRDRGALFVDPGTGWLACREIGAGRMAEPEEIVARIDAELHQSAPKSAS